MTELMDVYDKDRNLTGIKLDRNTAFLKEGQFMLYVLAIIENPEGEILITRRDMNKKWAAGFWEVPGGGAKAGETSFMAVCREVQEETGLVLSKYLKSLELQPVYSYQNVDLDRGDNYFVDIYHFVIDFKKEEVVVDPEECIDWTCADLEQITEIAQRDSFLHYKRLITALENEKG